MRRHSIPWVAAAVPVLCGCWLGGAVAVRAEPPLNMPIPPFPSGPPETAEPEPILTDPPLPPGAPPYASFPPRTQADLVRAVFKRFPGHDAAEIMPFIEKNLPQDMHRCRKLARQHWNHAVNFLSDLVQEALDLRHMQETRPELFQRVLERRRLEARVAELADLLRALPRDARSEQRAELRRLLKNGFDLRQEILKAELADMQAELDELTELIAKRSANRDLIIERKLRELTGDAPGLEW